MQVLAFLSLLALPLGEARVNGLADAAVTIADQPLALYVNPALLTRTRNRELLVNTVGFEFGTDIDVIPHIIDAYTNLGFLGYSQPIQDFGAGLAGFQDEAGGRGILVGAAYKLSFLHTGASAGVRYTDIAPHFHPAFALGAAITGIKFADVPGEIALAVAARMVEQFNVQAGMDYNIAFFRFLINLHIRDPFEFEQGVAGTAHLAALLDLEEITGFPAEIGGGWGGDNRWGVLAAADLNLAKINLSYSQLPGRPGMIGFSFLFSIASTEEVEKQLAAMAQEQQTKNRITSNTYVSQGVNSYNESDYEAAIQAFDVALIWDPSNKDALNWLERVKEEQHSSELRALIAAANAAIKAGDYLEAISKAEAAVALDSTSTEARRLVEEAQRKFSESIFSQTSSLRNAGQINALYQEGLEQYAAGDYKAAAETWEKIEKLQPRSQTLKTYKQKTTQKISERVAKGMKQMEALEKKGDYRQALLVARQLQRLVPANSTLKTKIASYESKIKTLTAQYEAEGIDYYNRGYYMNAQKSFYTLLALDPNNATAKQYLERIESRLQKKDADELYLAGIQAYTNNRYEEAISYWKQVLKIDPGYKNASRNIQRAREKLSQLKS